MRILDNLIILTLIVSAFIAGMKLGITFLRNAEYDRKQALNEQFVRLKAGADADDPCKPYVTPTPQVKAQPIGQEFMNQLHKNGRATTKIQADITK